MAAARLADLSDGQLCRRILELGYRRLEVAIDPDHPASKANGQRWARELKLAELEQARREREPATDFTLNGGAR